MASCRNTSQQCASYVQVHKAECPGTFVIGPEISTAEALQLAAGGGGQAKEGLSQWTDGLAAIFKGEGCILNHQALAHSLHTISLCSGCKELILLRVCAMLQVPLQQSAALGSQDQVGYLAL